MMRKFTAVPGAGGRISDYTLAQLKKLDAGSWFSRAFAKEKIPTLGEVLALCKDRMAVNIEIKTEAVTDTARGGIEEKCLEVVHRAGMHDHVVFSSFDPRALKHLKTICPAVGTAVLYEKKHYGLLPPSQILASLGVDAFNCSQRELNASRLADLREHGIPFHIYTVDDEKKMKQLMDVGAKGIFTNAPDVLRKVLANRRWTPKNSKH